MRTGLQRTGGIPAMLVAFIAVACFGARAPAASNPPFELQDALQLQPDPAHGRLLYGNCVGCHQPDGSGASDKDIPIIAGQHYRVVLEQLAHFRATERTEPRMHEFASRHFLTGPQDMADVAAYVAKLQPRPTTRVGPAAAVAAGTVIYADSCSRCHEPTAQGKNQLRAPRLAGQHYRYLVLQIQALRSGERIKRSWDHTMLLQGLSREQILGIASHLSRLTPGVSQAVE